MKRRFVVIGLGNFGANVARTLHRSGNEVIAIDTSEERIDRIGGTVTRAAVGDGRDAAILSHLGAAEADVGIISTGDDITASVLSILTLADIGVRHIIVKVISDDHRRVMQRLGASATIFPEKDSAENLAEALLDDSILSFLRIGVGYGVQEMKMPPVWAGKTLRDLELRQNHGISIVGVHTIADDTMQIPPDPDEPLHGGQTLIVAGSDEALHRASELEG